MRGVTVLLMYFGGLVSLLHGQSGKSLVLDGRGNYYQIPDHTDLNFQNEMTIEFWINPNCIDYVFILSKQQCNGQFGYSLAIRDGKLLWGLSSDGFCNANSIYQTSDAVVVASTFSHIAIVQNQTSISIVVNGVAVNGSFVQGSAIAPRRSTRPFILGAYTFLNGTTGVTYSGLIDEFRFWKKALTLQEINQRKGATLVGNERDLVLYFDMESNTIGVNAQLVNKANTGNIFNAVAQLTTTNTPYFTTVTNYNRLPLLLADRIESCGNENYTASFLSYYHTIRWSDNSGSPTVLLSNKGFYWLEMERERCKFFRDTLFFDKQQYPKKIDIVERCEGQSILFGKRIISEPGLYYDTLPGSQGCDTAIELTFLRKPEHTKFTATNLCFGDTIFFGKHTIVEAGVYLDTIKVANDCDTISELEVFVLLGSDTVIYLLSCDGLPIEFRGRTYSLGLDTIIVLQNSFGCDSLIKLTITNEYVSNFLGEDYISCDGGYTLQSPSMNTIWSTNTKASSIRVTESGVYFARYIDHNNCMVSDTVVVTVVNSHVFIPNSFSPNNDALNDCFGPLISSGARISNYYFEIYNRWGERVYKSTHILDCWDGVVNGKPAELGVYFYKVSGHNNSCTSKIDEKGTITLIR